jgi:type IV pilus assembly protein PilE
MHASKRELRVHEYFYRGAALRGRSPRNGFTVIEVMIVVAIVAILAAIALPNYSDYVKRGKIIEATSGMSDLRQGMEQWFLDHRTYVGYCASTSGLTRVQPTVKAFTLTCPTETVSTYAIQADGVAAEGMSGFTYTLDNTGAKKTTAVPSGWGSAPIACWVVRKGGGCT